MQTPVRKLGNSAAVLIPRSYLIELRLRAGDIVDLAIRNNRLVLAPLRRRPRKGWAEAAKEIAEAGDDQLIWPEFANRDDANLEW
jgi:antitoxin MazE